VDHSLISSAPYFDTRLLREQLTAIFRASGDHPPSARPQIIERLKLLLKDAHAAAEQQLMADGNGRRTAEGLSRFQDELIRLIFDYTVAHVYRVTNPSDAERMSVIATGGYGRSLMAPGSDIDLLFLLPYKQTPWGESVVEHILMILWDLGQKVGHATRTVDQSIKLAITDMTIRTALLDARPILGDDVLFAELKTRFEKEVMPAHAAFIEAKLAEREARHKRVGESRYRVEPNIKEGKGGLRDLHTLHWLAKDLSGTMGGESAFLSPVFTVGEQMLFRRCEKFRWTVRCHLHFLRGRAEERLTFDVQPALASRLGYGSRGGLRSVERFMKHYFLVAKDVGDLTTFLCSGVEMQQLKTAPRLAAVLNPLNWRIRRAVRRQTDFRIDNGRINVADRQVFARDPLNLLRFFVQAERTGSLPHPEALRLLRQSLRLINSEFRNDPEANRLFLELLMVKGNPEATLRRMNETGVLGRFIPDFGRVVSMMQFNMYHHFTVDEHLIRTVGELARIEHGEHVDELPVASRIFPTIQNRRALFVAALLHDIAKGRKEDHSIAGAAIARRLCPRLGLTPAETDTVAWLVEQHLVMSNTAQSRDLGDPKSIRSFADIVQSPERLKLLLLLTVADIRAVGPGTWNGWKGQLLRALYYETEPVLAGGHTELRHADRIAEAQEGLRKALADWPAASLDHFIARPYPDYWLKTDAKHLIAHAHLVREAEAGGKSFATSYSTDAFTAVTELTVLAPNHPRLLALFAGACAAAGANIVGAHISTTRDGLALDTFQLQREFVDDDDEHRRANRISKTIENLLRGEAHLPTLMSRRRPLERRIAAFTVEPEVIISNGLSDTLTVIEVAGRDRTGLLYELTNALSDLSLDITSAHITTFGEKALDVFYVTDLTGKKIDNPQRQRTIRNRLAQILHGEATTVAIATTA
jgi:[protein-PII] uridylyltransferase